MAALREQIKNKLSLLKSNAACCEKKPGVDGNLSTPFTSQELSTAFKQLKIGKAQDPDNIPPEFLMHCDSKCLNWMREFYSLCLRHVTVLKIWRRATVVAILKPNKLVGDPKSYRPISLLCVPYKVLERLLLLRLNPVVDPQLPNEQAVILTRAFYSTTNTQTDQ